MSFWPVSYTHLDVYKRQGLRVDVGRRDAGRTAGETVVSLDGVVSVSYTHLDVYKRQVAITEDGPVILTQDAKGPWCSMSGGVM